jgi:IclR family acetate operon transcriptional repressor
VIEMAVSRSAEKRGTFPSPGSQSTGGGVQSLERALDLLELLAEADGELGLSELSNQAGLPLPTVHRLMRTLMGRGYARQLPSRRYALGPRLIWLGEVSGRLTAVWARPYLAELVKAIGETANMAMMDGDEVVYVAQVPSKHPMRMFTEVGRRVMAHRTGVGKVLLAQLSNVEVEQLLARTGMPASTTRSVTDPTKLITQLEEVRRRGYAIDDGEQEIGVRCVAVPVLGVPTLIALSVSGPEARITDGQPERIAPILKRIAASMASSLAQGETGSA